MPFTTDNRKWAGGQCLMKVDSPSWDPGWRQVAVAAMGDWNMVVVGNFRFKPDPTSTNDFGSYNLGRWSGWMAMTYTEPDVQGSNLASVQVLVNLYYEWMPHHKNRHTDQGGAYDLATVLRHELGHALHLGDDLSSGSTSLMRGSIKPGEMRQIQSDDIAGLNYLYP